MYHNSNRMTGRSLNNPLWVLVVVVILLQLSDAGSGQVSKRLRNANRKEAVPESTDAGYPKPRSKNRERFYTRPPIKGFEKRPKWKTSRGILAGWDSGHPEIKDEFFIRYHRGNVAFGRTIVPPWFRPIYRKKYREDMGNFAGSYFVVTHDTIMIADDLLDDLELIDENERKYRMELVYSPYDRMGLAFRNYYNDYHNANNYAIITFLTKLGDTGFSLFKFKEEKFEDPDYVHNTTMFNWILTGPKPTGYDGCFGFKYTQFDYNGTYYMVSTEFPVEVKNCNRNTYCEGHEGPVSYLPYSSLDGQQHYGNPIFCGPRGLLKYFNIPIYFHENDVDYKLLPLRIVMQEVKKFSYQMYRNIVVDTRPKRKEIATSVTQIPLYYRALYRSPKSVEPGNSSYYAGSMIVLTPNYFLVPDRVAERSIRAAMKSDHDWLVRGPSKLAPSPKYMNFSGEPPIREDLKDWPRLAERYHEFAVSLYYRPIRDIEAGRSLYGSYNVETIPVYEKCYLYTHQRIGKTSTWETRKMPIEIVHNSCGDTFCYFMVPFDEYGKNDVWDDGGPIVCGGVMTHMMIRVESRPLQKGRLALMMHAVLRRLKERHRKVYAKLLAPENEYDLDSPNYHPVREPFHREVMVGIVKPPAWFRALLYNAPGGGPMLGYAGPAIVVTKKNLIVHEFVADDSLIPDIRSPRFPNPHEQWLTLAIYSSKKWLLNTTFDQPPPIRWKGYVSTRRDDEDFYDWPKLNMLLSKLDHMVLTRDKGFNHVAEYTESSLQQYAGPPFIPSKVSPEYKHCWAYTYLVTPTLGGGKELVFSAIPVKPFSHDANYCYFTANELDPRTDLSKGYHGGVPIVCNGQLNFINSPYPDGNNRAGYRAVYFKILGNQIGAKNRTLAHEITLNYFSHAEITPPPWYRLLRAYDEHEQPPNLVLGPLIVLSDVYFVTDIRSMKRALANPKKRFVTYFSEEQPTPDLVDPEVELPDALPGDNVTLEMEFFGTGLGLYKRNEGFETRGNTILKRPLPGRESDNNCYVYVHVPSTTHDGKTVYVFRRFKVDIVKELCYYDDICKPESFKNIYLPGAPIVCDGVLSYIYGNLLDALKPSTKPIALRITAVYGKLRGKLGPSIEEDYIINTTNPPDIFTHPTSIPGEDLDYDIEPPVVETSLTKKFKKSRKRKLRDFF